MTSTRRTEMRFRFTRIMTVIVIWLLTATAPALGQLALGDIVATPGLGPEQLQVFDSTTGQRRGFLDSTYVASLSALWNPGRPAELLIGGGNGRVASAVFETGDSPTLNELSPSSGTNLLIEKWFFGPGDSIAGIDLVSRNLWSFDLSSATSQFLTVGPQPWGNAAASCYHPQLGDFFVGGSGGIYRWNPATGASLVVALGSPTLCICGMALDPFTTDLFVTTGYLGVPTRVLRVTQTGTTTDVTTPGLLQVPGALCIDERGDLIVMDGFNGFIYRLSQFGGPLQLLAVAGPAVDVSVVGGLDYGSPLNPFALWASEDDSGAVVLTTRGFSSAIVAGATLVSTTSSAPLGAGLLFGVTPDSLTSTLIDSFPSPGLGNPFHFLVAGAQNAFPFASWTSPSGTGALLSGSTLDFVTITYDGNLNVVDQSNVARLAF